MRLALDSNPVIDLLRGDRSILHVIEEADEIFIPFVVGGELRIGFDESNRGQKQRRQFDEFMTAAGASVLFPDGGTLEAYAALARSLEEAGRRIPTNDLWISAVCVQHGLSLLTRDAHFGVVPRLRLHARSDV